MKDKILDANAIYSLINLEKYSLFKNASTLDLARYELGNAILKEALFTKSITLDEAIALMDVINSVLNKLNILSIKGFELEVLKFAYEKNLTFYDASYLYIAIKNNMQLITEDKKLYSIAKEHVTTYKVKELI